MPGALARTSTMALTNATLPYALEIADRGWREACKRSIAIQKGLNLALGNVCCRAVAETFDLEFTDFDSLTQ